MGLNFVLFDVISLEFTKTNCFKTTKQTTTNVTDTLNMKQWDTQGVERNARRADWRRRYFKVNTDGQRRIEVCVMSVPKHPTRTCVRALTTATCILADFCGHTRNNHENWMYENKNWNYWHNCKKWDRPCALWHVHFVRTFYKPAQLWPHGIETCSWVDYIIKLWMMVICWFLIL